MLNHTQVTEVLGKYSDRWKEDLLNGICDQSCFSGFSSSHLAVMQLFNKEDQCSLFSQMTYFAVLFWGFLCV